MRKSKAIKLVLVVGLLSSCNSEKNHETPGNSRLWVRGDSASDYSHASYIGGGHYFHFSPYGYYHPFYGYRHAGYESSGFSSHASHGISRGGFGHSGIHVGG